MTRQKKSFYYFIHFGLVLVMGILIGKILEKKQVFSMYPNSSETKIKRLINYIENDYVDEINTNKLLDETVTDMLEKLDPHSTYLSQQVLTHEKESMSGRFFGIGVQYVMLKDTIFITNVLKNSPSEKAGLKKGDRLLKADKKPLIYSQILEKENVSEKSDVLSKNQIVNDYILNTLRGKKGEVVTVSVYRKSIDRILKTPITRGEIPIESVKGGYMITPTLGYIEIVRFGEHTHEEFENMLQKLIKQGMTSLVLDLRGNPGGYMKTAFNIADEFLKDGKLVVFTENRYGKANRLYATKKGIFENQKVYVLIDQSSASASEIVAGALQDNDKGTIIGRRSFGKGLVQQQMDLGDGSAVRLTTSRYYTPTGRSIQKPYKHDHQKEYDSEYTERSHNGELYSKDSIKVNDSLKFITPKGKVVYGGGGIIPDVFIPMDTTFTFNYGLYKNINSFVYTYIENHSEELEKWKLNNEITQIDEDEKILNIYLKNNKIQTLSTREKKRLHTFLKALLAQNLINETAYYKIIHQKDKMIQKVLELEQN